MDKKPLTSVHEALNNATFAQKVGPGRVVAFRVDADLVNVAMRLCYRHGTTLSEFLRQCMLGLASDYVDPDRE